MNILVWVFTVSVSLVPRYYSDGNWTHILVVGYYISDKGRIDTRDSWTMAVQFGHVGKFEEGRKEWKQYADSLLTANGITDREKKQAMFLSVIGPKVYKLLGQD